MHRAGLLEGLPDTLDISAGWELVAVADDRKVKAFEEKFGVPLSAKLRHVPDSFARLTAKAASCNTLCMLEPGDFSSICLPYILGQEKNASCAIGSSFVFPTPDADKGYVLGIGGFIDNDRVMLMGEVRLMANNHTPKYHVVVGDLPGRNKVAAVLKKLGDVHLAIISRTFVPGAERSEDGGTRCQPFGRCHFGAPEHRPQPAHRRHT